MIAGIISELRLAAHFHDTGMMQAGQVLAKRRLRYAQLLGQAVHIFLMAGQMNTDLQALGIGELAEKICMIDETLVFCGLI